MRVLGFLLSIAVNFLLTAWLVAPARPEPPAESATLVAATERRAESPATLYLVNCHTPVLVPDHGSDQEPPPSVSAALRLR